MSGLACAREKLMPPSIKGISISAISLSLLSLFLMRMTATWEKLASSNRHSGKSLFNCNKKMHTGLDLQDYDH
jgi:xanthine/uracil permease